MLRCRYEARAELDFIKKHFARNKCNRGRAGKLRVPVRE